MSDSENETSTETAVDGVVIELKSWSPVVQITAGMLNIDPTPPPSPSAEMLEFHSELVEDIELMCWGVSKPKIRFRRDGIRFHKAIQRIGAR